MNWLMRWLRSLQAQLILWAVLPVTLVIIGLALTGVYSHQQEMLDFVIERDRVLANVIARRLEEDLAEGRLSPSDTGLGDWLEEAVGDAPLTVWIVDRAGQLLATTGPRAPKQERDLPGMRTVLAQEEGALIVPTVASESLVITFTAVRGAGWRVVTQESAQEVIGPILRFSSLGPVAAVVAAGLSVIILTFGWRTIVRPLQRLSDAAEQVSWGNHGAINAEISGVAEIEDLHQTLADMVARLESYQTGVLDYLDAVTQGQEQERARLAREIHDGPVQSLIALSQRTEMAHRWLQRGDAARAETLLRDLRSAEVGVIEDLRRIVGALRPAYLEDLGFVPALDMLVKAANARNETEVQLTVAADQRRLDPEVELAAYRIVQEALSNALHHADADHVVITVRYENQGVRLQVADDGVGFVPAAHVDTYTRQGHFGLVGLQERVRQLEGTFKLEANPGKGTSLDVWLPDRV